ncbi:insulin gene enhancer protein ISL-1-like isoform X1 [Branchiostoma lanceolatum]|uniref:Insulin gene enhancer protein ISL-1 n=1 Tax=Branchiostoma lanceolatum TaxID=7740 RepID=A0A8J9ZKI0_BRALA|nr:ISL1 [Branchiostoma lanceolatum]
MNHSPPIESAAMPGDPPKKNRRNAMCVGCGSHIHDQYILRVAPDLEWHAACLKCSDCNQYLDETCTCFVREGKTYCKRCYVRLFGTKCAKCSLGFTKNDFVMRARNKIYHIDCFRCVACSRQLIPGDEFALREDGLFCKADHEVLERASNNVDSNGRASLGSTDLEMATRPESHGRSDQRRPQVHKQDGHKPTRVRTVLNEKQLHTLRTCYAANPRPDALMKEQLVEMTGLSPRVIRVWFQNKRCKDKKKSILMKQMQEQASKQDLSSDSIVWDTLPDDMTASPNGMSGIGRLNGVPMVAQEPVRHESQMQANPVEVQSYQQPPPWKALSDFALQSDIEQPAFQQLKSGDVHAQLPCGGGMMVLTLHPHSHTPVSSFDHNSGNVPTSQPGPGMPAPGGPGEANGNGPGVPPPGGPEMPVGASPPNPVTCT